MTFIESLCYFQAKVKKFGPKILQLLTEWAETFPSDFREEKMVAQLKDLVHRIAPCDEVMWAGLGVRAMLFPCVSLVNEVTEDMNSPACHLMSSGE